MLNFEQILIYANTGNNPAPRVVNKSEDEWRSILTPEQFRVTRQKGTERQMSSNLCTLYEPGVYACVCCDTDLFDSNTKYDSRTGWPSFTEPIADNVVSYHKDESFGTVRIEITCSVCDAHLGHVFPDGPEPTGLRFCTNGISLKKR